MWVFFIILFRVQSSVCGIQENLLQEHLVLASKIVYESRFLVLLSIFAELVMLITPSLLNLETVYVFLYLNSLLRGSKN